MASLTLAGPLDWRGSTVGSLNLGQSLLRFGLVDRLELWMYPVLLGSGKQVFTGGIVPTALRLIESAVGDAVHASMRAGGAPTAPDVYGLRPMNASSLVWTSASSGTWTRGPYWPLSRSASSIGSMPSSIAAHLSGSSVSS